MPFYSLSTPQVRDRHLGLYIYIFWREREICYFVFGEVGVVYNRTDSDTMFE